MRGQGARVNGIHDLGGMHGHGPVERDPDEPPFAGRWEAIMVAVQSAVTRAGLMNIDEFRFGIERMDPAHYLGSSYFEHWLDGIVRVLVEKGQIDPAEVERRAGIVQSGGHLSVTATRPSNGPDRRGSRRPEIAPRFRPGDAVRTRNEHPVGHTRLPRYARGRLGAVERHHGTHVFPDTNADGRGEGPEPLYSVRFDATELWGQAAGAGESVNLDLWESYLLPA